MADAIKRNPIWKALVDPLASTRSAAHKGYAFQGGTIWWMAPMGIGIVCLVISLVLGLSNHQQFYFSYLIGWSFCLSIALGSLFFVLIQHLTKARWSVVVRRVPEALMWAFPILLVLAGPLVYGMHDLYHWTHEELMDPNSPQFDPLVYGKRQYLNTPFFLARLLFYFLAWSFVSYRLYTLSLKQDVQNDRDIPAQQRKVSAYGLVLFAVTVAFAGFDLLMSLDPHWFSTIFGVYFFAGGFVSALALTTLTYAIMQRGGGMLNGVVNQEHYHDLGKLLFGFTVFWTYIAFSQYMLIWYGNLPEETIWFRHRLEGNWRTHSWVLLIFHFIIPFIVLLPRASKRILPILSFMCVWLLVMHWFDYHWLVMPVLETLRGGHGEAGFHLLDITCWLGLFGVTYGFALYRLKNHSLVPQNDPYLAESLRFTNT